MASRAGTPAIRINELIAAGSFAAIVAHLLLRLLVPVPAAAAQAPLIAALALGGLPLLWHLLREIRAGEIGADWLAGISIVASAWLGEYLAGTIVVLMLSGGSALEQYAVRHASFVLRALAQRMPSIAHRKGRAGLEDVPLEGVAVGDRLVIFPHEACPVDGVVVEGHSVMDESFLTGEPFDMAKAPGSAVISGAVNGDSALTIQATKRAVDSRYAKITEVMRAAEEQRPRLRRLGDQLGAFYAPLAMAVAGLAWLMSGQARRFLAVLVVATPCPLLIGIPVAILGAISLAAKRSIIIKDPAALEQVERCSTIIFDKTGTLTYGQPTLTQLECAPGMAREEVLALAASLERYSKHPLGQAILAAAEAQRLALHEVSQLNDAPGQGLSGVVLGRTVQIVSRGRFAALAGAQALPPAGGGLECIVTLDGAYAALLRFRDTLRKEGLSFIAHLGPRHRLHRVLIVSGDRRSEVAYLAEQVGITEIFAEQSPEEKLVIARQETARAPTLFVGDGVNDAPALMASTVGVAMGQRSDITSEAADVVIMDSSLAKLDEFIHISCRMRAIALQSAVGGMALSLIGMALAAFGYLPPVAGAVTQEAIDVLAVVNALRAALVSKRLTDFEPAESRWS